MQTNDQLLVSALTVVNDADAAIEDFVRDASAALAARYGHHEVVIVGNGPSAATEGRIRALLDRYEHVRYIRLSQRCAEETAVSIGLENVIGDWTAVVPAGDPVGAIPEAVEKARSANAILFGTRRDRLGQPWWARLGARCFHWYTQRVLGVAVPENASGFVVIGRRELNAFLRIKDTQRHLVLATVYTGYPHVTFACEGPAARRTERGFLRRLRLFYDVLISTSLHPLRVVSALALLMSLINALYLVYIAGIYLLKPHHAEGWPSISVQNSVMFFFVFLVLGVLCEYVAKITKSTMDWPRVFIAEERRSSVLSKERERTNVVSE